jgi:hypothetical protein
MFFEEVEEGKNSQLMRNARQDLCVISCADGLHLNFICKLTGIVRDREAGLRRNGRHALRKLPLSQMKNSPRGD